MSATQHFAFGANWQRFLSTVDEERVHIAEDAVRSMLGVTSLAGSSFLDIGSGSGLSSLAAVRLGAARVHSFDYDVQSVEATQEIKRRYAADADNWTIERGDVMDVAYLDSLGTWDVVYSWGVLHHTGDMWRALEGVARLVAPRGILALALYNDQGLLSRFWHGVKRMYNRGSLSRIAVLAAFVPCFAVKSGAGDILKRHVNPLRGYREYSRHSRGMSRVHDWIDWLGGYPFEVARPEALLDFYGRRGFSGVCARDCGASQGCNEFIFQR